MTQWAYNAPAANFPLALVLILALALLLQLLLTPPEKVLRASKKGQEQGKEQRPSLQRTASPTSKFIETWSSPLYAQNFNLMQLLNKLFNLFCLLLCALWSGLVSFTAIPFFWLAPHVGQAFHHAFGRGWLKLLSIHVNWVGLENIPKQSGFILAPNHESMFDVLVIASVPIDFSWISKKEVGKIPFLGWSMRAMGCYFVARDRSGQDLNTMREVEAGLKQGKNVVIFPEGTRTRTGELLPFKKGAFRTAQNAGVPLLPIAITGTRQIARPGEIPSKRGHEVTVRFGKPFAVPLDKPIPQAMEEFRAELMKLLAEDRAKAL